MISSKEACIDLLIWISDISMKMERTCNIKWSTEKSGIL